MMKPLRLPIRILNLALVLVLAASCAPRPQPAAAPQAPASTLAPASALPAATPVAPAAAIPAATSVAPSAGLNLILGRPTTNSITASLYSTSAHQVSLAYGTQPGQYSAQSAAIELKPGEPQNIELGGLSPDTAYYYTLMVDGAPTDGRGFHTARAPGSSFTFTIDADPHNLDPNFNGQLYAITLSNALAGQPDFHIDLGDTFMTEKLKSPTYADAESTFTDMRPYFGIIGAGAPLFLVNGNHEGELGWLISRGGDQSLAAWTTQLRQRYYPNPTPNGFYTGAASTDPTLGGPRDGYYAWTWGDALFIVLDPFWYTTSKPRPDAIESNWNWTLGREQYDWLKTTLEGSSARYKFVFTHHLVGGSDKDARGGIEAAPLYEWGGNNADGTYGFDQQRPGWGVPIHQLLVQNHVSAVFHGHDHVFVHQELDGIVYQEVPQPSMARYNSTNMAKDYGYTHGDVLGSSGHLLVTVTAGQVTVEYVRAYLPKDENSSQRNGQVDFTYTIR